MTRPLERVCHAEDCAAEVVGDSVIDDLRSLGPCDCGLVAADEAIIAAARILGEVREIVADALDGARDRAWGKAAVITLDHIDEWRKTNT